MKDIKTPEELNALKEEVEALDKKLHELSEKALEQVSGGMKQKLIPDTLPTDLPIHGNHD